MENIIFPKGIEVGHSQNEKSGVTVILAKEGAVGGVDVRGCAPGTRETDLLRAEKAIEKANAIVLCGGSSFGLLACDGVMKYLLENGKGHHMGDIIVPLVSGAVIYDLTENKYDLNRLEMGYEAAKSAKNSGVKFGCVGAGTGATLGKILGAGGMAKGGVGAASILSGGVLVSVVTVVNALGDVYNSETGNIVSGARLPNGDFLNTNKFISSGEILKLLSGGNTTLSCVTTNAKLSKLQANKLASIAHDGYAKAISPVHTDYDGDTIFALATGEIETDFTFLSCLAVEAVRLSILDAVK